MTSQNAPAARIALAEAAAAASVPAVPARPARPVRFTGNAKAFWRLLLRGALLLAVTLGIYRFWLATDVRRFLWSHTEIAGESLEYNGTAAELLIGFLIAIALLVPINLTFFVLALSMGAAGEFVSMLGFPLLFVLGQFAIYRARRYRLTRTVLRGVRFHQTGSAMRYAFCATFWWVLIVLTLGLAYPFMQASLERYKMRNTFYGDLGGRFDGSGWRLFGRGVFLWLLVMVPLLVGIFGVLGSLDFEAIGEAMGGNQRAMARFMMASSTQAAIAFGIFGIGSSILLALLLFPVFQAMVLRWWLDGIRFGALTVRSHLLKRRIYGAYLRFLGLALLLILATVVIARHRAGDLRSEPRRHRHRGCRNAGQRGALCGGHARLLDHLPGDGAPGAVASWRRVAGNRGACRARPGEGHRPGGLGGRRRPRRRPQCGRNLR